VSSSATRQEGGGPDGNAIVSMFEWWNRAFSDPAGFTPEAFGRHYTDAAELVVNGQLRGKGLDALAAHYRRLQHEFDSIQMELPVIDSFCCGDRAFVQCVTRAVRAGQVVREGAMAVATVSSGKMSRLEVSGRRLD